MRWGGGWWDARTGDRRAIRTQLAMWKQILAWGRASRAIWAVERQRNTESRTPWSSKSEGGEGGGLEIHRSCSSKRRGNRSEYGYSSRRLRFRLRFWPRTGRAGADFPSKPITVVIPLAAGGAVDTNVRIMLESMRPRSASRSWSRTSAAPAAPPASTGSRARRPTATRSASAPGARTSSTPSSIRRPTTWRRISSGGAVAERAALVHRAEKPAAEGLLGVHRLPQGKRRQGHGRLGQTLAAARRCAATILARPPAPASRWCPIAAARRRCRISWRATST